MPTSLHFIPLWIVFKQFAILGQVKDQVWMTGRESHPQQQGTEEMGLGGNGYKYLLWSSHADQNSRGNSTLEKWVNHLPCVNLRALDQQCITFLAKNNLYWAVICKEYTILKTGSSGALLTYSAESLCSNKIILQSQATHMQQQSSVWRMLYVAQTNSENRFFTLPLK